MLKVVTFLWFDPRGIKPYIYDASYVTELRDRVKKNLSLEHEFLCVSDRDIPGIKTIPLDFKYFIPQTRFAKLMLFDPRGPLAGDRVLYLDLDCLIVNSIEDVVSRNEDLVLWRNPNFGQPGRAFYNTSIILHTVGTRPEFWADFGGTETWRHVAQQWGGTDQAWISYRAAGNTWGPSDEAHWTDADGIYGHGRLGDKVDGAGTHLPDNARIVFFPGNRTHKTAEVLEKSPWVKDYE